MKQRWLPVGALLFVVALAISLSLRQATPESGVRDAAVDVEEVLGQALRAVHSPQDAGISTLAMKHRIVIYSLGSGRTSTPWLSLEIGTWFEAPDRKRIETEVTVEGRAPDGSMGARYSQTEVWDGVDHWTLDRSSGVSIVRRQEQTDAPGLGPSGGGPAWATAPWEATRPRGCATSAVTGERTVAGRDAWVVESGRPRCGFPLPGEDGRRVQWVDKETGLVLGGESYAADGRLYASAEITQLAVNGKIDPDSFRFAMPGDAVLRDYRDAGPVTAPMELGSSPSPISLAHARAEATFDVGVPAVVPRGFERESVEHYWADENARALRSHADWVRLRYANADGEWLVIEQGFGGPLFLFASAAPDSALQGDLTVAGARARWIDGNPATGWEPGAMMLLHVEGGPLRSGWAAGPGGGVAIGRPVHLALASNVLSAEDLIEVAESMR